MQNPGTIETFTRGYCYWFAFILQNRFGGIIFYNPIDNHFACDIDGSLYDITGYLGSSEQEGWIDWASYCYDDCLDAERVTKNCILKIWE